MLSFFTINSYGQDVAHMQTKEYATVYLSIAYQGNVVDYDKESWSKSPLIYMPDGKVNFLYDVSNPNEPKEIKSVNGIKHLESDQRPQLEVHQQEN